MGNFLSSISLFIARRTDVALQSNAAQATSAAGREGSSSEAQRAASLPAGTSAVGRPGSGEYFEPVEGDAAHGPSPRQLPLVAYAIRSDQPAPPKQRQSRAMTLMRTSPNAALTSRTTPTTQTSAIRTHESHPARLVLTETEKVRLQVMQVQIRLSSLSLYEGPIDGILNPETVTGVRHFQTLKGTRVTGTLAAGTLSALGVPPID